MTYCVAIRNDAGLVLQSDSRTNAGLGQINIFRKMRLHEVPGERVMVLLTAGNLAVSQAVASGLKVPMQARGADPGAEEPGHGTHQVLGPPSWWAMPCARSSTSGRRRATGSRRGPAPQALNRA